MIMLALRPQIMVLGRVGMAGNAEDRPTGEKLQQPVAIDGILCGIVGIEIRDERNMHGHDDQPILRRLAQHVGDEGKLALADAPFIFAACAGSRCRRNA